MKDKLYRLPKWLRFALLLCLIGLMLLCLWLEADTPRLSPQGALREAEQQALLEYGDFLTREFAFAGTDPATRFFVAVSRTKTQLHMTEVKRDGLLWQPNERALSVPVEDPVTAVLLPWQINIERDDTAYPAALVYCPDAAQVTGSLTIDGTQLSGRAGKGENGCWLVAFESLYDQENEELLNSFRDYQDYLRVHLPMYAEIVLTIDVYDGAGNVFDQITKTYPTA